MNSFKDPYAQIKKNTVDSSGQIKDSDFVKFHNPNGKGLRVMFVGNSITLHNVKPEIGWFNYCGMAASTAEKDYVHLLEKRISKKHPDAAFCICQVASWEREYKRGKELYSLYSRARSFSADIIIFRFVENITVDSYTPEIFLEEYKCLFDYLNGKGDAELIVTTGFWKHPADECIRAFASNLGIPVVELSDLGELDEMKAIGLFEHGGVANHPGDKGMKAIADRIMNQIIQTKAFNK